MKDLSLRRSLSERKLAKKERKDKTRSAHFERSLTPISIIGEKRENSTPPSTMNGDVDYGTIGGKRNKFWKLKVTNVIPIKHKTSASSSYFRGRSKKGFVC